MFRYKGEIDGKKPPVYKPSRPTETVRPVESSGFGVSNRVLNPRLPLFFSVPRVYILYYIIVRS